MDEYDRDNSNEWSFVGAFQNNVPWVHQIMTMEKATKTTLVEPDVTQFNG